MLKNWGTKISLRRKSEKLRYYVSLNYNVGSFYRVIMLYKLYLYSNILSSQMFQFLSFN